MLNAFHRLCMYAIGYGVPRDIQSRYVDTPGSTILSQDSLSSAQRTAQAAGHARMGVLLSTMDEKAALKQARKYLPTAPKADRREQAFMHHQIELLGKMLVESAERCLPPEITASQIDWQSMSLEEQADYIQSTAKLFYYGEWAQRHPMMEEFYAQVGAAHQEYQGTPMSVLPKQYGQWPENGTRPNCLGVSLMLVAWLDMIGADYLFFNLIRGREEYFGTSTADVCRQMLKFATDSPIDFHPDFMDKCRINYELGTTPHDTALAYHHAVVVRLKDGSWVMVDPYMHCVCLIGDEMGDDLEQAKRLLGKYQPVLPGLTILVHDWAGRLNFGLIEQYFTSSLDDTRHFTPLVEDDELKIKNWLLDVGKQYSGLEFMEAMIHSSLSYDHALSSVDDYMTNLHFAKWGYLQVNSILPPDAYLDFCDGRLKEDGLAREFGKAWGRYYRDPHFARRVRHHVASMPLEFFETALILQRRDFVAGEHPSIEVALPHYQAGLMVMNHLRRSVRGSSACYSPEFSSLGSSQILWSDALLAAIAGEVEFDQAEWQACESAARLYSGLPDDFLHPLSREALARLERCKLGEEGEMYGYVSKGQGDRHLGIAV